MKFLLLFFFVPLSTFAYESDYIYSSRYKAGHESTKDLNTQKLIELITSGPKTRSVENSLELIFKAYPAFTENYVLMYQSRSLQKSSYLYPRTLLIGHEARFIMSFNGDPEDHGYHGLEIMEFDADEEHFVFRELLFTNGSMQISETNPSKCMRCHQSSTRLEIDPRPNWEPYNFWLGAYSSVSHGNPVVQAHSDEFDPDIYALVSQENEMYERFSTEVAPHHERYKHLTPMEKSETFGTYFPSTFTQSPINRMPTNLTQSLGLLNMRRLLRLLEATPIFESYKEAILAIHECRGLPFEDEIFYWHKQESGSSYEKGTSRIRVYADIFDFIFKPYHIDTSDWSMDFGTGGRFAFKSRFGMPRSFPQAFTKLYKEKFNLKGVSCEKLNALALQKTSEYWKKNRLELLSLQNGRLKKTPLIKRCAGCHTSYAFGAPYIPFDDEEKLKISLDENFYPRGFLIDEIRYRVGPLATFDERMPADGYLPHPDEIKELFDYLQSLIDEKP